MRTSRTPDLAAALASLPDGRPPAQLILCSNQPVAVTLASSSIDIPSLITRSQDLPRIVAECATDAAAQLKLPVDAFGAQDIEWLLAHGNALPEVEKATLRLLALRATPSLSAAAARLGMAPVSLRRWMNRRLSQPPLRRLSQTR